MNIHQTQAFLALANELHFGRAAQKLFITQPALSRNIRKLEEELGENLFERSTRTVKITAAGKALIQPGKDFLDAHERAISSVAQAALGEVGRIRLGFAGASSHLLVSRLVCRLAEDYPGIQVDLFSSNFARVGLEKLIHDELDIAYGRWGRIPAGIATRVLVSERAILAVSENHPLASRDVLSFAEVADEPFVMLPDQPSAILREWLFELSHRVGTTPHVSQIAPDTWTVLALVAEGLGVSLTFDTVRDSTQFPGVVFIELNDSIDHADLSLAWRDPTLNPAVRIALGVADAIFGAALNSGNDA